MRLISTEPTAARPISLTMIVLLALAVHGPLLLMQLPLFSYDANTHMFFAAHYAHHWFNPWNEKWFAGFSQTTYPPLTHQLIALLSHIFGLGYAYMAVQLLAVLLLPIGVYRFARLWVNERAAGLAAIGSIFLGSLAMLVYQSGQINTTLASAILLNSIPFFYAWIRDARFSALVKGVMLVIVAAAAHHVTVIFATLLFALPVVALAILDRNDPEARASTSGILSRTVVFGMLAAVGIAIVLLPYWISLFQNPIKQAPIPHASRDNYILNVFSGINFWVVPYAALILAIPYIFWRGASDRRLRPLFFGWYVTLLIGLGGTTPVARLLLGRLYEILTYERYTYWSTLMALPIAALGAEWLIRRYSTKAIATLASLAVISTAFSLAWTHFNPINAQEFSVQPVVDFLNRDNHAKFRYMTLGFAYQFSNVSTHAEASSIDGDYNSARLLPELTQYGAGRLDAAKYFGANGMESLRAVLKHASQYGLKYIFVRDRYYEPLLAFAGWRQVETYDNGLVTLWSKEDIPPAHHIDSNFVPPAWQGFLWGTLPVFSAFLAIVLLIAFPDRRLFAETVPFPRAAEEQPVVLREAN